MRLANRIVIMKSFVILCLFLFISLHGQTKEFYVVGKMPTWASMTYDFNNWGYASVKGTVKGMRNSKVFSVVGASVASSLGNPSYAYVLGFGFIASLEEHSDFKARYYKMTRDIIRNLNSEIVDKSNVDSMTFLDRYGLIESFKVDRSGYLESFVTKSGDKFSLMSDLFGFVYVSEGGDTLFVEPDIDLSQFEWTVVTGETLSEHAKIVSKNTFAIQFEHNSQKFEEVLAGTNDEIRSMLNRHIKEKKWNRAIFGISIILSGGWMSWGTDFNESMGGAHASIDAQLNKQIIHLSSASIGAKKLNVFSDMFGQAVRVRLDSERRLSHIFTGKGYGCSRQSLDGSSFTCSHIGKNLGFDKNTYLVNFLYTP